MSIVDVKKILREIHSDANGQLSWGRTASTFALVAGIAWISRLVFMTHTLPAMDGITAFVVGPYGANKVAGAAQSFSQNPVVPPPNKPQ